MSPAVLSSPAVTQRLRANHFGRSFAGFFGDYASTSDLTRPWGEGGLSWKPLGHGWVGDRVSTSHDPHYGS